MKISTFAAAACAVAMMSEAPQALAQKATAEAPAACWRYSSLSDGAASRFGIKGAPDDTILSRAAYYSLTSRKVTARPPFSGSSSTWLKVELRAEADGADDPLTLTGLLVELDNVKVEQSVRGVQFETHSDESGRLHHLRLVPLVARFSAGDAVVDVPFRTQGPDFNRQDIVVRLGAYPAPTWVRGSKPVFDPTATLPVAQQVDAIWKQAGTMTIAFVTTEDDVIATSEAFPYLGDRADAEFVRLNSRAREMISGGECQFISD